MARRPRKSVDPSLDLSLHLRSLGSLPSPWAPSTLFAERRPSGAPDRRPVELEVGSGKGLFLAKAATAFPQRDFVGIEIARPYATLCAARLVRLGLSNAAMLVGDAGILVRHILADASLAATHVYFPDPWWKARHRKRRVLSADFLSHAGRAIEPGGRLYVWTDVEEYFLESLALAAATGSYDPPRDVVEQPADHDLDYRTHFERRTRLAGGRVWRAELVRNASPAACHRIPLPDEASRSHAEEDRRRGGPGHRPKNDATGPTNA